ncbi:MAG: rhomboid family intramembrane serine protease [Terriglobia bacterium]|jgi:membrane associated rhomboid family serine protease/Tfp pilus assembly protein PilF
MADQPTPLPAGADYHEVAPRRYWPVATLLLLALNFLFFGLEMLAGGSDDLQVLLNLGASFGPYLRRGEYWRLVMPMFLHGGWLHILGNSYVLYILGPVLERVYGYARYATIYVAAGVGGAFLSMEVSRDVSVGASGAIFGVAGAMLVSGYIHRDVIPPRWGRAFGKGMILFIVINLAFGLSVHGIDNWGHLGGLASGALLALVIPPPRHDLPSGEPAEPPSQALVALPLAVVILALAATAINYRTIRAMDRLLAEGEGFESAHQYDPEFQCFQQAVRLAPHEQQPHEELGTYYLRQKKYDQAIQEFQEAIRLTEGDDRPRLELGLAYQLKGDPQWAQVIFEQVLGRNPQTTEGQRLLATNHVLMADLYDQQKLYGDAIKNYQEALSLDHDLAEAHNNLAWLYATCEDQKYRDPKAALEHATVAVNLSQWKQGDFVDTLAESYFVSGNYQKAVEVQKRALALEPDNKELQEHMVRYRKAAGI